MIGTISKVFKREGKTKPGAVVFSDGKRLTTWSDALVDMAAQAVGQLAEYTIEMNGKYENLGSLTLKGAAPAQAAPQQEPARLADFGSAAVASAIKDLTAAIRELTSQLARRPVDLSTLEIRTSKPAAEQAPEQPAEDPITASQVKLAQHIGSVDAAEAMFASLRAKHGKNPKKLEKAVDELLAAHQVQA